jgi:hypothetical protein
MLADGVLEILGAWPVSMSPQQVISDLAERGVRRIDLLSSDSTAEDPRTLADTASATPDPPSCAMQLGCWMPEVALAAQFLGQKRRALRLALDSAKRLHVSLERAIQRRTHLTSELNANAFIAQWLERADRSLRAPPTQTPRIAVSTRGRPEGDRRQAFTH